MLNLAYAPVTVEEMSAAVEWARENMGLKGPMQWGRAMAYVDDYYPGGWAQFVAEYVQP